LRIRPSRQSLVYTARRTHRMELLFALEKVLPRELRGRGPPDRQSSALGKRGEPKGFCLLRFSETPRLSLLGGFGCRRGAAPWRRACYQASVPARWARGSLPGKVCLDHWAFVLVPIPIFFLPSADPYAVGASIAAWLDVGRSGFAPNGQSGHCACPSRGVSRDPFRTGRVLAARSAVSGDSDQTRPMEVPSALAPAPMNTCGTASSAAAIRLRGR
jgi:hypothetical protein